jgi:predicted ATPase
MQLIRIQVPNFKSFEKLGVNLSAYNVLMGADATGKSNIVSVLNFLKDIAESGLDNAISMQGGVETLGNMSIGTSDLRIQIDLSGSQKDEGVPYRLILRRKEKMERRKNEFLAEVKLLRYTYEFTIAFGKKRGFRIVDENLEVRFGISEYTSPSSRHALPQLQELTVKARRVLPGQRLQHDPFTSVPRN